MIVDKIALILVIVGALNWGGVGLFGFDTVAFLFGGQAAVLSRIVYALVGLAGLWCVTLLFRDTEDNTGHAPHTRSEEHTSESSHRCTSRMPSSA